MKKKKNPKGKGSLKGGAIENPCLFSHPKGAKRKKYNTGMFIFQFSLFIFEIFCLISLNFYKINSKLFENLGFSIQGFVSVKPCNLAPEEKF